MTKYVCSHHVGYVLWILFNIGISIAVTITSINLSHPVTQPSLNLPMEQFKPLDDAYFTYIWSFPYLCLEIVFCGAVNAFALYLANERYHWLGLKECNKN